MAIQQDFIVKNGIVVRNTATINTIDDFVGTSTTLISTTPSLSLNFTAAQTLDPRISFTRSSGATYVGKDSLIKYADVNQPRFDYSFSSTGTSLGLLIEEQRTNYSTYSSDIGNPGGWTLQVGIAGSANFIRNYTTAPDGSNNATFLYHASNAGTYKNLNQTVNISTGQSYTYSIWAKNAGTTNIVSTHFDGYTGLNSYYFTYNFITDTFNTPTITGTTETGISLPSRDIYPNGWVRIRYTTYFNSGPARGIQVKWELDSATATTGTGFYLWGSQVEGNTYSNTSTDYATSYIPTSSATATRVPDVPVITGSSFNNFFNQRQGTVYTEFDTLVNGVASLPSNNPGVWAIYDPANGAYNGYGLRIINNTNFNPFQFGTRNGSNFQAAGYISEYVVAGKIYKVASSYYQGFLSSTQQGKITDTASDANYGIMKLTTLQLGWEYVGGNPTQLNGHLRRFNYYPSVVTPAQLLVLTSSTSFTGTNFTNLAPRTSYTASTSNFVVKTGIQIKGNVEVPDVDKLYATNQVRTSVQPSLNLNFLRPVLDSRITFTRASVGSYVGADGYIKFAASNVPRFDYSSTSTGTCLGLLVEETRTNLLTYSTQLDNAAWQKTSSVVMPVAAIAPDGTLTVSKLIGNSGITGRKSTYQTYASFVAGTSYTYSVYLQQAGFTNAMIWFDTANSSPNAYQGAGSLINLATGTIVSGGQTTITNAGNGWYRCSVTFSPTISGFYNLQISLGDANGSGTATGDGVSGIYVWGVQLEAGLFATSYIPTSASSATRDYDIPTIIGQNFNNFVNNKQGTLFVEADYFSSSPDVVSAYRWPVSVSTFNTQKLGFFKGQGSGSMYYKLAEETANITATGMLGTTIPGTVFRAAVSYTSTGTQFGITNATTSATTFNSLVPGQIVDRLKIGYGDSWWCGHIRRIVYYPIPLSNTVTQALTLL